jgi:thioredoxin 1
MSGSNVKTVVGISQYLKLVAGEKRVIVIDFSTTWCGPCKRLYPYLEQLSLKYAQDLLIVKIDGDQDSELDEEEQLSPLFKVKAFPTLAFIKNGQFDSNYKIEGCNLPKLQENLTNLTGKTITF